MIIGITGHRDKKADWWDIKDFLEFHAKEEKLTVIHGGAIGFDTQVHRVIKRLKSKKFGYDIKEITLEPDYSKGNPKVAPLKRNDEIVKQCDIVLALYDGRPRGGTAYTIKKTEGSGKKVYYLTIV